MDEVERKYLLDEHVEALLGLGLEFMEPVWNDILTDEDKMRTMSNSESDSDTEEGDLLAFEEAHMAP